jgi:hypothetical protein
MSPSSSTDNFCDSEIFLRIDSASVSGAAFASFVGAFANPNFSPRPLVVDCKSRLSSGSRASDLSLPDIASSLSASSTDLDSRVLATDFPRFGNSVLSLEPLLPREACLFPPLNISVNIENTEDFCCGNLSWTILARASGLGGVSSSGKGISSAPWII